ncbi:MAG: glycosyltransferase [Alphaproteobacteria bacterium]|nr:glycosyltransferase [Alphaproteobacteria bacterium]
MSVAVILPCYNEKLTIATVVKQMKETLPGARVIVFDNNSKDGSGELAREAGAEVRRVNLQGKGNVVRRMFADVDADIYLMLDADATYDPATAPLLIEAVAKGEADMAIGVRKGAAEAFPAGHQLGNKLFNMIVAGFFGGGMQDIFSGYRAFSRRFAKSFPAQSEGFETETELSVYTLEQRIPFVEIPSAYGVRPEGSFSKLQTYRDGWRILLTIMLLYKSLRPMMFFGLLSLYTAALSLILGLPVIAEWRQTGLVARLPTAVLSSSLGLIAVLLFVAGMVLNSVARAYRESRHLAYLGISGPG